MKIVDIFRRKAQKPQTEQRAVNLGGLLYGGMFGSMNADAAMKLAAFYCGVDQISNSIGMLPMNVYKVDSDEKKKVEHQLNKVIGLKPNSKWTP